MLNVNDTEYDNEKIKQVYNENKSIFEQNVLMIKNKERKDSNRLNVSGSSINLLIH